MKVQMLPAGKGTRIKETEESLIVDHEEQRKKRLCEEKENFKVEGANALKTRITEQKRMEKQRT